MQANEFWTYLESKGYRFFSGVPCSIFKHALKHVTERNDIRYIPAVKENQALGVASGAWLAGEKSGILIQNSGLGNIINGLTSFNIMYKVPVLLCIGWRGENRDDAPEHHQMGAVMQEMLGLLSVPTTVLTEDWKNEMDSAVALMEEKQVPAAVIVRKGFIT